MILPVMNRFNQVIIDQMLDLGRLSNLIHFLLKVKDVEGAIVEMGCNKGRTSAVLSSLSPKPIYLYDSFQGLPINDLFPAGILKATEADVIHSFNGLSTPHIKKSWFKDLSEQDLPEKISFAHVDVDLYESNQQALELLNKRLVPGACVVIDDCGDKKFPGIITSSNEFCATTADTLISLNTGFDSFQSYFIR